jgi:DNA-binding transcriptional ArsR family regulator
MSRLLPFKSEATRKPDGARVLSLEDDATEDALSALSSETAREILSLVYEEPRTPPELRDEVGSSLQNVHYHLENLEDAGLIQPAGSGYSEKGTEMTVYAPRNEAVVLFAGEEQDRSRLKTALSRLVGGIGVLALASYGIDRLAEATGVSGLASQETGGADAGVASTDSPAPAADGGGDGGDGGDSGDGEAVSDGDGGTETSGDGGTESMDSETTTPDPSETETLTETGADTLTPTETAPGSPEPTPTPQGTPTETAPGTPEPTPTPQGTPTQTPMADTGTPTESAVPTEGDTVLRAATDAPAGSPTPEAVAASGGDGGLLADPAVAFFLGGTFMLVVVTVWWYYYG